MTEHDCAQLEELISAQIDGATTPAEDARIERHLSDCADCRATVLAFEHVDREVSDYLRATPVPAIGTPWREARRTPLFAQWRPATLALTTILVLVVASVLAFGAFRGNTRPAQQTSAPQSAYTTSGSSGGAAASTAPTAAPSTAASAAPAAVPAMAPTIGTRATAASGAASSIGTPAASGAPSRVAGSSPAVFNPVQLLRLDMATGLTVCQPDCTSSPHGADTFSRIIAVLNTALPVTNAPTMQSDAKTVLLKFAFADGQEVELQYLPPTPGGDLSSGRLALPDGRLVIAPAALGEALAAPKSMP